MSQGTNGLLLGVLCALLLGAATGLGWMQGLERGTLDAMFRARGVRFPGPDIVLLVVDDETVARAGQWPLPRRYYADAVNTLSKAGVKAIAFDFLFSTSSASSPDDVAFIKACARSKRVVHAAAFHVPFLHSPTQPISARADVRPMPSHFSIEPKAAPGAPARLAAWASSASPELRQSSPALGHVNVYPESDGALRRVPHLVRYRDGVYPSLALAVAAYSLG
ncbi:MAG TPA: CHASE2 domain-containing protein, partial [Abditibacteriaceae bacterium]